MINQSRKLILFYFYKIMIFLINSKFQFDIWKNLGYRTESEIKQVNQINHIIKVNQVGELKKPEATNTQMDIEILDTKKTGIESKKDSPSLTLTEKNRLKIERHEKALAELKKREEARIEQENYKKEREENELKRLQKLDDEKKKFLIKEEGKKLEQEKKQEEKELLHEKMLNSLRKKEEERRLNEQHKKTKLSEDNMKKVTELNTMLGQLEKMVCEAQKTLPLNIQKILDESIYPKTINSENGNNVKNVSLQVRMSEKQLGKIIKN